MSYTTIKAIWPGERAQDLKELRNSHWSAPYVWDILARRYLHADWQDATDKLWTLADDRTLPPFVRAVLVMTFDRAYIAKNHYRWAASQILEFLNRLGHFGPTHWGRICYLLGQEPDCPAIGFQMTSCGEGLWENPIDWPKTFEVCEYFGASKAG